MDFLKCSPLWYELHNGRINTEKEKNLAILIETIFKIYIFIKKINLIRKITLLFFEIQLNRNNILNSYFNDFTVNW